MSDTIREAIDTQMSAILTPPPQDSNQMTATQIETPRLTPEQEVAVYRYNLAAAAESCYTHGVPETVARYAAETYEADLKCERIGVPGWVASAAPSDQ